MAVDKLWEQFAEGNPSDLDEAFQAFGWALLTALEDEAHGNVLV